MPVTFRNSASTTATNSLHRTTRDLEAVFQRLASGQRINKAGDDAAGLSLADSLGADSRVYSQALKNTAGGITMLSVAESALSTLGSIAQRLQELAGQASNGVLSASQRSSLDSEAQSLANEYFRIVQSTEYNGQQLFSGETQQLTIQAGYGISGQISSSLGGVKATGAFSSATFYAAESKISADLALKDLNNDGVLDIVTAGDADGGGGQLSVRLGLGDGQFSGSLVTYAAEATTTLTLSLGDVNGDGIFDAVTAGEGAGGGRVTVRLGVGDGTFQATSISYSSELTSTGDSALEDLNGDGALDLITSGSASGAGYATVRLGNGDGTFKASTVSYAVETTVSRDLTMADLNGDNVLDMISAGDSGGTGYATIRLGNGDGTFGSAVTYQTESKYTQEVKIADVNRDGIGDLLTAGQTAAFDGEIHVRMGNGDGTFSSSVLSYATESRNTNAFRAGDVNGDGMLDLVSGGYSDSWEGFITVRLGNGDGTFSSSSLSYEAEDSCSIMVELGDVDNDGVLDLVSAGWQSPADNGWVSVRRAMTENGLGPILPFSLQNQAEARQAVSQFNLLEDHLSAHQGIIGAFMARLQSAARGLDASRELFSEAESRIRDADVASDVAEMTRLQILEQSTTAVLAQANQQPQLVLQLLQDLR